MIKRFNRLIALSISAVILTADIFVPVHAADIVTAQETVASTDIVLTSDAVRADEAGVTEDTVATDDTLMPDTDILTDEVDRVSEISVDTEEPENTVSDNELVSAVNAGGAGSKYISPVAVDKPSRAQGMYWSSTAFSVMSAVEMSAAKKGIRLPNGTASDPVDLSELHLAYFMGKGMEPYDPLDGFNGDNNRVTDGAFLDSGSRESASQVLASWIGAADESKYPYINNDSLKNYTTDRTNAVDDALHVSGYYVADPVKYGNEVKELVKNYGAATIAYWSYEEEEEAPKGKQYVYSDTYNSFYMNTPIGPNHSALIVGWDDSFPKDHFVQKAEGNGAWLIRDSWRAGNTIDASGTPSGDDAEYYSYFWLSYYDNSIGGYSSYAFDVDSTDKYDHNYQYDGSVTSTYRPGPTKYANIFTSKAESSEYIKAVYFATYNANMNYKIDIYKGVSYGSPENGKPAATQSGKISCAGGHTIELNDPVLVRKGEKFSVVISVPSSAYMMLECTQVAAESWIETTAATEKGRSMHYDGGSWYDSDYGHDGVGDYRIKALTKEDDSSSCVTVTFDAAGGVSPVESKDVKINKEYGSLPEPVRSGYEFTGWFTSLSGGTQVFDYTTVSNTANHTLYARWKKMPVRVNLDAGLRGSVSPSTLEVSYGGKYEGLNNAVSSDPGQVFAGWYTQSEGGTKVSADSTVTSSSEHTLYAHWITVNGDDSEISADDRDGTDLNALEKDDFWVRGVLSQTPYTGSAIKFDELRLYKGNKRLIPGRDYTITYKNNTNTYTLGEGDTNYNAGKAPTVVINGKGNYTGKKEVHFKITPLDLSEASSKGMAFALPVSLEENSKIQQGKTTVYYVLDNGSTLVLKSGTDYVCDAESYASVKAEPGDYEVIVKGKGNYTGQLTFTETITAKGAAVYNLSKATVKSIPAQQATGGEVRLSESDLVVTYKSKTGEVTPEYDVRYVNNILPGTATVILEGKNSFTGTKTATFKITARQISKAAAALTDTQASSGYTYTGAPIYPGVKVTYAEKAGSATEELKEYSASEPDGDYTLSYTNNVNAGKNKANILIDGKNRFFGTLKKAFTINPVDVGNAALVCVTLPDSISYQKGGSKPSVKVVFHGKDASGNDHDYVLSEGSDYTLSFKNTNAVVTSLASASKKPEVTVKGKGNFTGSRTIEFAIQPADINETIMHADDVVYKNKAGNAQTKFSLTDPNGKKLAQGTDYEKDVKYLYKTIPAGAAVYDKDHKVQAVKTGDEVDMKNHIVPVGTVIEVKVKGKGNYSGEAAVEYRMVKASVASANVKIKDQVYTGKPIIIGYDDIISAKAGNSDLSFEDYVIENCYVNLNKTGKIRIRGRGNYGCVKELTFRIVNPKF